MPEPQVRDATPDDLPSVKAVYDDQAAHGIATFDTQPQPLASWEAKRASTAHGDHFLVAEVDGAFAGFAYSSTYRPRPAYDGTRETTIYLADGFRGRGVGRALYDVLLARLRADGVHVALAVIASPNPASEALHRACGYERVGVLPEVGFKHGRWIDTAFWALVLDGADGVR